MINNTKLDKKVVPYIILGLFSILLVLLESPYTSILNPYYGLDSTVYMIMGRGWTMGRIPYIDLYDHKGPLIYLINAIGFWISDGKLGVMLVQMVNMYLCICLVYKITQLFAKQKVVWLNVLVFAFLYCATVSEGDMTEEWSLLFSLIPVYITLSFFWYKKDIESWRKRDSLVMGMCLGAHAMIRINNAAIVVGILFGLMIILIKKQKLLFLLQNMLIVIAGLMIVFMPFAIYFCLQGAFDAFIQGTFIHNIIYAAEGAVAKSWLNILIILLRVSYCPVLVFFCIQLRKREALCDELVVILISSGVISAACMLIGNGWIHYYLTNVPIMIVTVALAGNFWNECNAANYRAWGAVLGLACILPFTWQAARHVGKNLLFDFAGYYDERVASVDEIMNYIPEEDQDSIWAYDVNPSFYMYAKVLPCYKYFSLQSYMASANLAIDEEISCFIQTETPKYIVIPASGEISNDEVRYVIENKCKLITVADYGLRIALYEYKI